MTTEEAFQEQYFLWERGASKIFCMQNIYIYKNTDGKDKNEKEQ